MKTGLFALLLVGILFALGDAFTFPWQTRRDVMQIDSRAVATFEGMEGIGLQHLEARKSRGGSRTTRKRPAKKRPAKKRPTKKKTKAKKKTTKKPTKKPTKKTSKKCTAAMKKAGKCGTKTKKCTAAMKKAGKCKGTATKKCTAAMKKAGKCTAATKCTAAMQKAGKCKAPTKTSSAVPSGTSAAACKWSPKSKAGGKGNSKLQARIEPDPCRPPSENDRIMIENYKIAEKAARKKRQKLKVNQMYLFLMKQGPTVGAKHHSVMVGKVMKVGNQLGMEATIQQLGKPSDGNGKAVRHENAKFFCGSAFGGVCQTGPYRRVECGKINAKYKLVGGAGVEFADPEHFIQKGEEVFMAEKPYNVLTWNCQVFAKNLINVTKLKSGQIVELTDEQARPSEPLDSDDDSDEDWSYNPEGGFRVIDAAPLPYDRVNNNGARFEID